MKILLIALFALLPTSALAHPGHLARVNGHTHSLFELAGVSTTIALVLLAYVLFLSVKSSG